MLNYYNIGLLLFLKSYIVNRHHKSVINPTMRNKLCCFKIYFSTITFKLLWTTNELLETTLCMILVETIECCLITMFNLSLRNVMFILFKRLKLKLYVLYKHLIKLLFMDDML